MLCPRVYPYYLTKLVRVSVIVTLIAALLGFSNSIYLLIFVYTFLSTAFFLVRLRTRPFLLTNSMLMLHTRLSFDHYARWYFPTRPRQLPP